MALLPETYLQTLITIELPEGWRAVEQALPSLQAPLHVLTAWNPGDERPALAENRERNARLAAELEARASAFWPALGSSPDGSHSEESFAVSGLSRPEALELGRQFGQVAVFEIRPGLQTVLACDETWDRSRPLPL